MSREVIKTKTRDQHALNNNNRRCESGMGSPDDLGPYRSLSGACDQFLNIKSEVMSMGNKRCGNSYRTLKNQSDLFAYTVTRTVVIVRASEMKAKEPTGALLFKHNQFLKFRNIDSS
ncbi:hypothetical protein Tcan_02687 [Toxocara canis]|uniref:Uncharacterized protein n=1 Tax=Toxocara canis TaxID=6265 RepID=A0A0B2VI88_TOXCA|nr:hypothetical protein Tcan_02687 [Toxocara canis]